VLRAACSACGACIALQLLPTEPRPFCPFWLDIPILFSPFILISFFPFITPIRTLQCSHALKGTVICKTLTTRVLNRPEDNPIQMTQAAGNSRTLHRIVASVQMPHGRVSTQISYRARTQFTTLAMSTLKMRMLCRNDNAFLLRYEVAV
jgi:hypothetical protein